MLATVMGGFRGTFVQMIVSAIALSLALLWGGPWRERQVSRLGRAIAVIAVVAAIGIFTAATFFPDEVKARWALYTETLYPRVRHRNWAIARGNTRKRTLNPYLSSRIGNGATA